MPPPVPNRPTPFNPLVWSPMHVALKNISVSVAHIRSLKVGVRSHIINECRKVRQECRSGFLIHGLYKQSTLERR